MLGPASILWLALVCSPTPVGEAGVSPCAVEPAAAPVALVACLSWERPDRSPRDTRPIGHPVEPIAVTETESEEESGGEGGEGLAAIVSWSVLPIVASPSSIQTRTSPPGRARRPVTCLRC